MAFYLSTRSKKRLEQIDLDLEAVVYRAIELSTIDFMVVEGIRSYADQKKAYESGKSWTMNSKHLTGHAVDLAPLVDGQIPWDDRGAFAQVSVAMFAAAKELEVAIRWGGDWNQNGESGDEIKRGVYDGPHFELV